MIYSLCLMLFIQIARYFERARYLQIHQGADGLLHLLRKLYDRAKNLSNHGAQSKSLSSSLKLLENHPRRSGIKKPLQA